MNNEIQVSKQDKIKLAYDLVLAQKNKLKKVGDANFKTNGKFRYTPNVNGTVVDITSCKDIARLIELVSFLNSKKSGYDNAATKDLKLTEYPIFNWLGYAYEEWIEDVKLRVDIINYKDKFDALNKAERDLAGFMNEDTKADRLLDSLTKDLNLDI